MKQLNTKPILADFPEFQSILADFIKNFVQNFLLSFTQF